MGAERERIVPALAEVFRAHGYEGASLAHITRATGFGKGSLYHFFPGGKEEMAAAVLDHVERWFRKEIFEPLRDASDPRNGIETMFEAVDTYFHSGERLCIVGLFALSDARDRFAAGIRRYFTEWVQTLAGALIRAGLASGTAKDFAVEIVAGIQGALLLARAAGDPAIFQRVIQSYKERVAEAACPATEE